MVDVRDVASGLRFPEGPVALDDGNVLVVEIARGTLDRVWPDGTVDVVADVGGGPNGAALGPDGRAYLCNNGGCFRWEDRFGFTVPGTPPPDGWRGGSIQRVDLDSGAVEVLYTESSSGPLRAPNDLVFDDAGGFWFSDHGVRLARSSDRTGVHYAKADGSSCVEVVFPLDAPNGVGLAPDGGRLYVAETHTGRLWAWDLAGPGQLAPVDRARPAPGGQLLCGLPGLQLFDSLAVDNEGRICVGTLVNGGITCVSPDGAQVEHTPLPDPLVTNLCFAPDQRTAYVTLSATGRLVAIDWPPPVPD